MQSMKKTKFQDSSNNCVQVSYAGDGDIRIYISESFESEASKACLKLSRAQANLLVAAITDLIDLRGEE